MGYAGVRRDVFLKIEPLADYSPLAPIACSRRFGRDAMLRPGHELGRVQPSEIVATTLDALVYREYLDGHYTVPNTAKLVPADVNEPPWDRRIPGSVLYARPGERLYIHVLNGDPDDCHSFHLHGLRYGIDSDGAWPFGVGTRSGRRSDEIVPGQAWTYVFDATPDTIGAWAFHDHVRMVQANVNRGLFGALVVRDPAAPCAAHEVPMFLHQLQSTVMGDGFESPVLTNGGTFDHTFPVAGFVRYWCKIHGTTMGGTITVDPASANGDTTVRISDNFFTDPAITVRPGSKVTWVHRGSFPHIVFAPGGGAATFCLNGRSHVGNTPTIEAEAGEKLRWYMLNLDLGSMWHNFHPHSTRWQLPAPPAGASDVHALSPAESFVADTEVPEAVRLPCVLEDVQCDPPESACRVRVKGDFLFHCHLEEHMMGGLSGLVRSKGWVWVTKDALASTDLVLPYDDGRNDIAWVDLRRCGARCPTGKHDHHGDGHDLPPGDDHQHGPGSTGPPARAVPAASMGGMPGMDGAPEPLDLCLAAEEGVWELLPCDSHVLAVHAVLMHTGRILFFAGSGNNVPHFNARDVRSVVWDYENGSFHTPNTPFDVFCAGQTLLADGKVLVAGGTDQYDPFIGAKAAYLFDPHIEEWIRVGNMAAGRWYPTLVTLGDGRAVASSGNSVANEIYDRTVNWATLPPTTFLPLYPHLMLMQDGRLFFTGGQLGGATLDALLIDALTGAETVVPGLRDRGHRDQSTSVLLPPAQDQRVMIMGGGGPVSTASTDIADLGGAGTLAYAPGPDLLRPRTLHNAVVLPDRTVFVSGGGLRGESRADSQRMAEIYDPATNAFRQAATATVGRLYHSIALLLPDGRVITAGSNPDRGDDELRLELFHPPYLFRGPRPFIQSVAREWTYGSEVGIHTPQAASIRWAQLIRPMAVTHSDDCSQRLVDLPIRDRDVCHLHVLVTGNPNLAPPGWYMLFLCDEAGVPSVAEWVHLGPAARKPQQQHDGHGDHVEHPRSHHESHQPGFPIPGFDPPKPPKGRPKRKSKPKP
jgi:FtsP/CotA-like multicopper oxidase with cupredoxin domain